MSEFAEAAEQVKLVALDIDGTLTDYFRPGSAISPRVLKAIARAREAGLVLAIATGRPWTVPGRPEFGTDLVAAQIGGADYAACLNGTMIVDPATEAVLHVHSMSCAQAVEVARLARQVLPGCLLAADLADGSHIWDEGFVAIPPQRIDDANFTQPVEAVEDAIESRGADVLTWLVEYKDRLTFEAGSRRLYSDNADADHIIATLTPLIDPVLAVRHSGVGPAEISLGDISKASALEWMCQRQGLSRDEVMAFGDGYNDLEMLAWAGHSVAMGNADPEVQSCARYVAADIDDDGVAVVLEELLQ